MQSRYSYTYKRNELSEAEIYQAGAAREELEAAKKAVVNLYRYIETPEEITTRCQACFVSDEANAGLEYIDKAAVWDICATCDAQNVPAWYHVAEAQ